MKYILGLLFCINILYSQTTFTDEEVLAFANEITKLQQLDSLHVIQIKTLTNLVNKLEYQLEIDSLIISQKNIQIQLLKDRELLYQSTAELTKPKLWNNKYLWYGYGALTIIISSWVVSNIK